MRHRNRIVRLIVAAALTCCLTLSIVPSLIPSISEINQQKIDQLL